MSASLGSLAALCQANEPSSHLDLLIIRGVLTHARNPDAFASDTLLNYSKRTDIAEAFLQDVFPERGYVIRTSADQGAFANVFLEAPPRPDAEPNANGEKPRVMIWSHRAYAKTPCLALWAAIFLALETKK